MPITNFPQGVSSFGVPVIGSGPLGVVTTGQILFVNSSVGRDQKVDGSGQGTTPQQPFKTLNYAITQCNATSTTKNQGGDVIYVMPGHVETVSAAAGLAFGVAGITVIGLGSRNNRPQITLSATASTVTVTSNNVTIRNFIVNVSIDEVVSCFQISGNYCTLDAVDFVETSAKQLIQFALVTGTDCIIQNCIQHQSTASASNTLWIQGQACDRLKVVNNIILITTTNSASSSILETDTTAPVNILFAGNTFVQLGGSSVVPVSFVASTSGIAIYNNVASPKSAIAGSIALASMYGEQNFASHTVNKNGILEPVADS